MIGNMIHNPYTAKVGTILEFASDQIPAGWLVCDGSTISRTLYKGLFKVIGTTYGAGDGTTTFKIPDLVHRVIQGGTSGTYKTAGLPNITGQVNRVLTGTSTQGADVSAGTGAFSSMSATAVNKDSTTSSTKWWNDSRALKFDASKSNSIYGNGSTVQPPALYMAICIKY